MSVKRKIEITKEDYIIEERQIFDCLKSKGIIINNTTIAYAYESGLDIFYDSVCGHSRGFYFESNEVYILKNFLNIYENHLVKDKQINNTTAVCVSEDGVDIFCTDKIDTPYRLHLTGDEVTTLMDFLSLFFLEDEYYSR